MPRWPQIVLYPLGAVLCVLLGMWKLDSSFASLLTFRAMDRVPLIETAAVLPGPVKLQGRAEPWQHLLKAPHSGVSTLYYYLVVEREEEDSDGDTRWVVESTRRDAVPFWLYDASGRILLLPGSVAASLPSSHVSYANNRRYTEYRIDPGLTLFVFGQAQDHATGLAVSFPEARHQTPLLSAYGERHEQHTMAWYTVFDLLLGVALLMGAITLGCMILGIHKVVIFLAAISLTVVLTLWHLGLRTAQADAEAAVQRQQTLTDTAQTWIALQLHNHGIHWNGDWAQLANERPHADLYPTPAVNRIDSVRRHLYQSALRTQALREQFPENLYLDNIPPPIAMTAMEIAELKQLEATQSSTRLSSGQTLLMLLAGVFLAGLCGLRGIAKIKLKRLIENLPTTSLGGLFYGLNEVKGRCTLPAGAQALEGPVSGQPCVWYSYKIEEKRKSGKNERWEVVHRQQLRIPFLLSDDQRHLKVASSGATIITEHRNTAHQGNRRYSEERLEVGDTLYALGTLQVAEEAAELEMRVGPTDSPYLISNLSESNLMLRKASIGFFLLSLSLLGAMLSTVAWAGYQGAFGALPWLISAAIPLGYFLLVVVVLMYNDLVFLRQRARQTWSNIDVALRKRHDLVPSLTTVVNTYLQHERGAQEALAQLRNQLDATALTPTSGTALMGLEQQISQRLTLLVEQYPALSGEPLVSQLMTQLTRLEDEISFMRAGYNNAVERYNTRRAQIPDVILARLFGFQPLPRWDARMDHPEH